MEAANYGKGVALYQAGRYEDAATALRANLQAFANSPSVLDSQYLLALTLGTLANVTMQKATAKDATAGPATTRQSDFWEISSTSAPTSPWRMMRGSRLGS